MKKELRERVEKAEKLGYKDRLIFWCLVILFPVCGFFFVPMRFSSGDIIYRYYFDVWIVWGACMIVYVPYEIRKPDCFIRKDESYLYVWRWWKWKEIPFSEIVNYDVYTGRRGIFGRSRGALYIYTADKVYRTGVMKGVTQVLLKIKDDGNK